jgi:glycosyltransferase involved in cell wall biosynthesis
MMSSRLLFVSYTAHWTGPTNSLLLLLKCLRKQYHVAVLLSGDGLFSGELKHEGIPFYSFPNLTRKAIPAIYRLIRQEGFDLVYGNSTHSSSRNALIATKLACVPFVCHVREMGWGKAWRKLGFLFLANEVIAVSQACANSISQFVRQRRLHVVYNGIPLSQTGNFSDNIRSNLLAELGLPESSFIIASAAHVCSRKGQEFAVLAMSKIVKNFPNSHLLIIGSINRDSSYVEKLKATIRKLNLQQHISILGFRNDTNRLLHAIDLFLHTAIKDPHPRAVIEAMGAGLPVVAFSADGVAETVVTGQTGYLVHSGDVDALSQAAQKLASDIKLRRRLGENGYQRVQKYFLVEETARQVGEIIENTMKGA